MNHLRLLGALVAIVCASLRAADDTTAASERPAVEMVRPLAPSLQIIFKRTGGGLVSGSGSNVTGFVIAGSDRQFFPANAKIVGETIRLSAADVPVPVAARYTAPTNSADALRGKNGRSVASFRTDVWPEK